MAIYDSNDDKLQEDEPQRCIACDALLEDGKCTNCYKPQDEPRQRDLMTNVQRRREISLLAERVMKISRSTTPSLACYEQVIHDLIFALVARPSEVAERWEECLADQCHLQDRIERAECEAGWDSSP